jgi:hypothetical protein
MPTPIYDDILLNENAYFFKKNKNTFFKSREISNLFKDASEGKKGELLYNLKNKKKSVNGEDVELSICIFKKEALPSFIKKKSTLKWIEIKYAYLIIIDFKDYIFLSRKNISDINVQLQKVLTTIDYSILNTLFIESGTQLEKFSLNNTSVAQDAIRGKTVEAIDLKNSFSPYGASKYVLNSLRLNNNNNKTSITFNTSRITNFGEKKNLDELIQWAKIVVDKIRSHVSVNTFLDVFATPIDYETNQSKLVPISILFNLRKFHDDIENQKIVSCEIEIGGKVFQVPLEKIITTLQNVFNIISDEKSGRTVYKLESLYKDLQLSLNKKSITLISKKASRFILTYDDNSTESILNYFNRYNDYIINFDDLSLVYSNRKLFKDNKILSYLDSFFEAFEGNKDLNTVKSEKGTLNKGSIEFSSDSIFCFVEKGILNDANFAILDDLGNELADYIKIKDSTISFIHAKFNTSKFSASSFHDVVGQALKNIGNMTPSTEQLDAKAQIWGKKFKLKKVTTKISRLRKGKNIKDAIDSYKKLLFSPNLKREIILVINFISKEELKDRLSKLKAGKSFKEKNQVIQILWLLSSLISSCQENGVGLKIICKP